MAIIIIIIIISIQTIYKKQFNGFLLHRIIHLCMFQKALNQPPKKKNEKFFKNSLSDCQIWNISNFRVYLFAYIGPPRMATTKNEMK
ncbi:hypothetical protein DERP_010447 [Dermatophagoides pteronyssinus]|uniref:Uncharacterized protein n=1 Tax=Dermatophagoides pteronyssinus TaxID=6956 RepID=A0ABQ8J535_DERPT|nr:hypothetical protein DERP_010447 [Dermatophagoides pteronyssinus]